MASPCIAEPAAAFTVAMQTLCCVVCRATLVSDMSTNKALLKKLENTLLRELSNATGNILDNQELISTLESAKEKAVDISTKLTAAKATAHDIEEARVRYTPVATRGAVLFFVMAGLSAVNNMYEYSLAAFLKVFKQVSHCVGHNSSAQATRRPASRAKGKTGSPWRADLTSSTSTSCS